MAVFGSKEYWDKFKKENEDKHQDEENDKGNCPDCDGECHHIDPFKQCKNCKAIYKGNSKVSDGVQLWM